MEYADELVIEASVKQAQVGNGTSSWTTTTPSIILNEGDQIKTIGSWVSVPNSGENSIEIFDKADSNSETVDASFKFSYYKTMDTKNVVAFPYHSIKIIESDVVGYGYTQVLPRGEDVGTTPTITHYSNVPQIQSFPSNSYKNITEACPYDDILHTPNSDKYETGSYTEFLLNSQLNQGIRDVCNTGNRYTLMYKTSTGRYDFVEREVNLKIPKGFYTPDSLASFISDEMNQVYFNDTINGLNETMSNNGRYFVGMKPVAMPQLNLTNGKDDTTEIGLVSHSAGATNPIKYGCGLSKNISGKTTLLESQYTNNVTYMRYRFEPATDQDREDFEYMRLMVNQYCDKNSGWYAETGQTYADTELAGYTFHLYNAIYDGNGINQYIFVNTTNPYDDGRITFDEDYFYFSTTRDNADDKTGETDLTALLIGNAPPDYNNLVPLNDFNEVSPIGMPIYVGTKEKITMNGNTAYTCGKSSFNWFASRNAARPTDNNLTELTGNNILDYEHGNKYNGATNGNYNRWSLKNDEEPPAFADPDDINLQPILRKYPNFMKYGMELGVPSVNISNGSIDTQPIYPVEMNLTLTTLNPSVDIQTGNVVVENALTITRISRWYNFIQAQVDDGLIDVTQGMAYAHFMLETFVIPLGTDEPKSTLGSDTYLRNRPRGMVISFDYETFVNKTITDEYYWGFPNNQFMTIPLVSFVKEKYFQSFGQNTQGLKDYDYVDSVAFAAQPLLRINANATSLSQIKTGYGGTIVFGFGYSHLKTGWRNFTSMLCSYEMDTQDKTNVMFCGSSRSDSTYNDRLFIGARTPELNYDTTSQKFYWNMFYTPQQLFNEYNQGIQSAQPSLQPSVQEPFSNLMGFPAPNYSKDSDNLYSVSYPLNDNQGIDIIQYNKKKQNLYNDGLIILAPEITKHKNLLNSDCAMSGYISGNEYDYLFPVDNDFTTRMFCFDQDCRYNTFDGGTITNTHTTDAYEFNRPPDDVETDYETDPFLDTLLVSYGWGCFPTDFGFIEKKYEAGTIRPDPELIYDTMCGIQVYTFGDYNRTNWDTSLWKTLGFELTDMMPTPFQYCNQLRNFTSNFLTDITLKTSSYPMRTDGDLLTSGFISITQNIVGGLNYTIQMPNTSFINEGGLVGVNNLSEKIISYIGNNPINDHTQPAQVDLTTGTIIGESSNGASLFNGQLNENPFFIEVSSTDYGTKIYSSGFSSKLDKPFFLVRCSVVDDNYKYLNNATSQTIMPVVAIASKQYGQSDYFYSDDISNLVYTNHRKRVVNEFKVSITNPDGSLANTLGDDSTVFFKIIRKSIDPDEIVIPADPAIYSDIERVETLIKKKQLYKEEIDDLLSGGL